MSAKLTGGGLVMGAGYIVCDRTGTPVVYRHRPGHNGQILSGVFDRAAAMRIAAEFDRGSGFMHTIRPIQLCVAVEKGSSS